MTLFTPDPPHRPLKTVEPAVHVPGAPSEPRDVCLGKLHHRSVLPEGEEPESFPGGNVIY